MSLEITMFNTQKQLVSVSPDGDHVATDLTWNVASGDCTMSALANDGTPLPAGQQYIVSGVAIGDSTGTVTGVNSAGVLLTDTWVAHIVDMPLPPAGGLLLSAVGLPENEV